MRAPNLLPRPRIVDLSNQLVGPGEPVVIADRSLPAQGYRLRIGTDRDAAIIIEAADDAGAFYAHATVRQLAQLHAGRVPAGTIEDWPDLAVRGVMLDISRDKVPTQESVYALVDRLAGWKINQLQLYTEHTFAYRDHQEVWRDASPLSASEIRALDEYCRARFVELVPNQNCLGHWDRWLRLPRDRPLALAPDGWDERGRYREPTTIDPTNPDARRLVSALLEELLPNFTSRRVHVGLDEPWELPRERMTDYLDWVAALRQMPALEGREVLLWGDILEARPDLLSGLPQETTVCEWWYDAGYPWAERGASYEKAGRPWWSCPGTSAWQTILGRWDNCVANIGEAVDGALAHGAEGMLVTDWGDRGHLQYLPVSEPGFAWSAAQSWCRVANQSMDLAAALDQHCYQDSAGVLGGVVQDLGNAYLKIGPQFPNLSTLVLHLYFPQMQAGRSFTEGISPEQVDEAEDVLADAVGRLALAQPGRADGALVVDELRAAIRLVQLLCRYMHARLAVDGWLGSVPAATRVRLADELQPMIARHRELWLARNRPGGLDDSTAWLDHLERCYRSGETEKYWGGW